VAQQSKAGQKTLGGFFVMKKREPLTCAAVLKAFRDIAAIQGSKSQDRKVRAPAFLRSAFRLERFVYSDSF